MEVLKVSSKSKPKSVAGAIAAVVRDVGKVEIQAVGAGAVNQSVKSIAVACNYVASNGIEIVCIPCFEKIEIGGKERTSIKFLLESR